MFNINIDKYILICILTLIVLLFIAFIYYTKRKFNSINEYNKLVSDELNSYKENRKQYDKNLEESGIKTEKENGIIYKIIKITKIIRDDE